MPYDLQTAIRAARERNQQAPEWAGQPGSDTWNQWAQQWFEEGLNAGDPDLVRRAGGGAAEEGEGGIADWQNAASSSEWLGQRAPTPRELRRYARDQNWSEDFMRYDDRQLSDWLRRGGWDVARGGFAGGVEKPTETGGMLAPRGGGGGGGAYGSNWGGGYGGGGGAGDLNRGVTNRGGYGGAPGFDFTPPSMEEALKDPGYQFALQQGIKGIQGSAAAQGLLRTGGTLRDIMSYGQDLASQRYADVYGRQYQLAKDRFAPQYGSWQTVYDANLQKYLQREGNIYGLLNPTMPSY